VYWLTCPLFVRASGKARGAQGIGYALARAGTGTNLEGAHPLTRTATLIAVFAAAALAVGLSACGKDNYKQKSLTFTEKDTNYFGFNDAPPTTTLGKDGPQKLTPGDENSFAADVLDSSKKKVGELNGHCITTRPGKFSTATEQCSATVTVPGGSLDLAAGGKVFGADVTSGSVTGGTGEYRAAGGTFTSKSQGEGSLDTFKVQIPQK
jgi:hypothetical protein